MEQQLAQPFEHETRIRNYYKDNLAKFRPHERLIATEFNYPGVSARVDMRTVDEDNLLREWEFKIWADYESLGQILTYVAIARRNSNFQRPIRGVIAAFGFRPEVRDAIEIMNLGIEMVSLPRWLAQAGGVSLSPQMSSMFPSAIPAHLLPQKEGE